MNFFLDTNICIYFLKGTYPSIVENIQSKPPDIIKIPSIVKAELLYGAEKSIKRVENLNKILQFLNPYEIINFDDSATYEYAVIRTVLEKNGKSIGPNDMLIASIVMAGNGILVTNNENEFKNIKKLKIENWTK